MSAPAAITDRTDLNMTSKGQVLIPKVLRDRIGLVPGKPVSVGLNERGEIVVMPRTNEETPEQRRARVQKALERVSGTMRTGFATTEEYMDFIRPHRSEAP